MADSDLPNTGTADTASPAKSYDEQVEDISNLIDLDPAPEKPDPKTPEAEPIAAEDDPDFDPVDPDAEDAEDDDDAAEDDGSEGPDYAGGRFAADNAKVRMDDGTTITIAELKRNNLFQRDYTGKTTELSTLRKQVDTDRQKVDQYAQELNASRDQVALFAETYFPKPPAPFEGDAETNPAGFVAWQAKQQRWDTAARQFQGIIAQKEQALEAQQRQDAEEYEVKLRGEYEKFVAIFPVLKDPKKAPVFWDQTYREAEKYFGLSKELVASVNDHRILKALRSANAYERQREAAPKVREEVGKKPAMLAQGVKRADPRARGTRERQARSERLRTEGTIDAGVEALMDMDL